jgi:hypothetical protein
VVFCDLNLIFQRLTNKNIIRRKISVESALKAFILYHSCFVELSAKINLLSSFLQHILSQQEGT